MEENKHIDIKEELYNQSQPWIEYLIENYKNPDKFNSCLDIASENIRSLESVIAKAESLLKDFKLFKTLTLGHEQDRIDNKSEQSMDK